jgi:hypothetical protein
MTARDIGGSPFPQPEIGSWSWWISAERWGTRGIVDCILRLLEQEAISRSKARELLEYMTLLPGRTRRAVLARTPEKSPVFAGSDVPSAPWDELNFYERSSDGAL